MQTLMLMRVLTENHFRLLSQLPKLSLEFVSLSWITEKHRTAIERMKQLFGHHYPPGTSFNLTTSSGEKFTGVPDMKGISSIKIASKICFEFLAS